ncbi:hypothetical protein AWZ03_009447 [Drosophila navojoa]|uniref:Uncharacterized protein n=1 Tax=Drosophila navojoa TaxID=7232 RepID=A0A484B5K0_DRONA|nr:hypothetical protein AWZ03_009447 [Drosophila navojoa]
MSLPEPDTPLSSRTGFMRGRKRIHPHPLSELQNQNYSERPSSEEQDGGDKSTSMDAQATMTDDSRAQNSNNEQNTCRRYPSRKKTFR